jgi:hypothetical protein
MFCDAGHSPSDAEKHPILVRILELEFEGRVSKMNWENCKVCIDHGAPENTKVTVKCELDIAI